MPYRLLVRAASRATGRLGWARGAIGAGLGIAAAALLSHFLLGAPKAALPWVFGPVGASAVLVFVLPASPLAQPWPVIGGSLISALVGLVVGQFGYAPPFAVALAVGTAIGVMSIARCLHPPGGACALLGALNGAPLVQSVPELMVPLMFNLAALLAVAWIYNRATGHAWPHRARAAPPLPRNIYRPEDLDAVLEDWDEVLDVSRDDLDALFRAVERRALKRANVKTR